MNLNEAIRTIAMSYCDGEQVAMLEKDMRELVQELTDYIYSYQLTCPYLPGTPSDPLVEAWNRGTDDRQKALEDDIAKIFPDEEEV